MCCDPDEWILEKSYIYKSEVCWCLPALNSFCSTDQKLKVVVENIFFDKPEVEEGFSNESV